MENAPALLRNPATLGGGPPSPASPASPAQPFSPESALVFQGGGGARHLLPIPSHVPYPPSPVLPVAASPLQPPQKPAEASGHLPLLVPLCQFGQEGAVSAGPTALSPALCTSAQKGQEPWVEEGPGRELSPESGEGRAPAGSLRDWDGAL